MNKVKVKICEGTTCFVMGGETVQTKLALLTKKYADKIEITFTKCMKICNKNNQFSKAPYVMIEDEIISAADMEKVIEAIERKIG